MALTRTYTGFAARGAVDLPGRTAEFTRGEPIDVSDDEAKFLDGDPDWSAPKKTPSKKDEAPTTKGSEPDHKEP